MSLRRENLSSLGSLLMRTLIPSEQGPILVTAFNLNDLGSIPKYNDIVDWSLSI